VVPTRLGLERDAVDPQRRVALTVAPRAPVVLALLVLEDADLVVAAEVQDRGRHGGLVDQRRADLRLVLLAPDEEDLAQRHLLAHGGFQALDVDRVPLRDPVLLAAGPDDRVHRPKPPSPEPRRNTGDYHGPTAEFKPGRPNGRRRARRGRRERRVGWQPWAHQRTDRRARGQTARSRLTRRRAAWE